MDLALGPNGLIYVVNRGSEYRPDGVRIGVMTMDEEYVTDFSRFGSGDGELTWPTCIALDSDQNVYVTDEALNRISIFDKDGEFLSKWGVPGRGDGEFNKPSGIKIDKEDNVYVVDSANHRVQKFTKDGRFLANWGTQGNGEGQFNLPWGIAIDSKGDIYVADWRNNRIQAFTADGQFQAEFGSSGGVQPVFFASTAAAGELNPTQGRPGEFNRPTAVAVDKEGDIYVADWGNDQVQVLTPDGRYITTFSGEANLSKWGQEQLNANPDMIRQRGLMRDMSPEKHFWRPKAIVIDDEGRIVILDSNRNRLQVYKKGNY
jgi:DNA-binding beta-propeller fold protein YncE